MVVAENETEYSRQIEALNKLLTDHSKTQSAIIKQLQKAVIIVSICFTCILVVMIGCFFWYESRFETTETTTTELSTEGENADINSVTNGDMYNDDATHNE